MTTKTASRVPLSELIRVVVVDDEALIREGICMLLSDEADIEVVGSAGDGPSAISLVRAEHPAVVVMDIRMPEIDGMETTRRLLAEESNDVVVRVLMLTSFHEKRAIHTALRNGASGFLLKSGAPRNLAEAIRHVAQGNAWLDPIVTRQLLADFVDRSDPDLPTPDEFARLTAREKEVLLLLAQGLGTSEIVQHLTISEATVKTHISRTLLKLGLRDRAQAVAAAYRSGFAQPDTPPLP